MEKGCIFPDNLIHDISKEDNIVLYSLSRFCACTEKELLDVLKMRNKDPGSENRKSNIRTAYGYGKFWRQTGKKRRLISVPENDLKKIQETIKERLSYIPVSLACTAGKPGDSAQINAELHRYNPYLITIDIKNAYPSINTRRVYENLLGTLSRPLETRCPYLEKDEEKELFIRAVTHLCVSEDQLPQGASTSNQIQNIVMRKIDINIEKKLMELSGSHMVYSRYADDMAISFPHFSTMDVLKEKMEKYIEDLKEKEVMEISLSEQIAQTVKRFSEDTFILTDRFEFKYLRRKIQEFKEKLQQSSISRGEIYAHVGVVDGYRKNIKDSNRRIRDINDEIIKIIGDNGRNINFKKLSVRNPQSNTEREINGMTFDHTGRRGIDKKKRGQYMRLLNDLIKLSLEDMEQNRFYRYKFKLNYFFEENSKAHSVIILNTINGIYNYIAGIYGKDNIPRELFEACQAAKTKRENYDEREKHRKVPEDKILKSNLPRDEDGGDSDEPRDDLPF